MTKIIQDVNFGARLREFRQSKQLSQEQVCTQMSLLGRPMLRETYSQIERGHRNIFASDLIALAKIYGVSFDQIFQGFEPVQRCESDE